MFLPLYWACDDSRKNQRLRSKFGFSPLAHMEKNEHHCRHFKWRSRGHRRNKPNLDMHTIHWFANYLLNAISLDLLSIHYLHYKFCMITDWKRAFNRHCHAKRHLGFSRVLLKKCHLSRCLAFWTMTENELSVPSQRKIELCKNLASNWHSFIAKLCVLPIDTVFHEQI